MLILGRGQEGLRACIEFAIFFRSSVENNPPPASLNEEEGDLLLAILVREFMKKMANEKERLEEGSR